MDKLCAQGPMKLQGEVTISGAKNTTLPILFVALLTEGLVEIQSVPKLKDVNTSVKLLSQLGAKVERDGSMHIDAYDANVFYAPYGLARAMRTSIWALGSLVARFGQRQVSLLGGCTIGARPIDLCISGLEQLGATIKLEEGYVKASVDGCLKGIHIVVDKVSVGAMVTTTHVATPVEGTTTIESAARGPEIVDITDLLITLGARISGQGTDCIVIEGVERLGGGVYRMLSDRIETGTLLVAVAILRGKVICRNAQPDTLSAVLAKLRDVGADIEVGEGWISLDMHGRHPRAVNVCTAPRPAFPIDMQAQFTPLNLVAERTGFVTEAVFENRFMHVPELSRMGTHTEVESNAVICYGIGKLSGARVMATGLRASTSPVPAGCTAEGVTVVDRIYHIDHGYERIKDKPRALGANIERVKGE